MSIADQLAEQLDRLGSERARRDRRLLSHPRQVTDRVRAVGSPAATLRLGGIIRIVYGVFALLLPRRMFAAFGFGEPDPDVRYFNALFGGRDIVVGLWICKAVREGDLDLALLANVGCEAATRLALVQELRHRGGLRPRDRRRAGVQPRRLGELARGRAPPRLTRGRRRRRPRDSYLPDEPAVRDRRLSGGRGGRTPVPAAEAPLAVRMRPRALDELVGQEHLLAEGSTLRTAIETGEPHSMMLYGPPGIGQDDAGADRRLRRPRGVRGGVGRERRAGRGAGDDRARDRAPPRDRASRRSSSSTRSTASTRPSRTPCCPAVEEGLVTLIGATTENPFFEVNSALLSRSQIYELRPLTVEHVRDLLERALADGERGIADPPAVDAEALEYLAQRSGGDARTAYGGTRARGRGGPRGRAPGSTWRPPRTRCSERP